MDRYRQLHSFVLIATKGSFAAAGRADGVTPVVMARRLTALESRLGAQLMHRSTRGLVLTESGEQFLDQARALLREFDAIESSVGAVHGEVRGHLTITAPAGFGRLHVAPHALSFRARYPALKVSLNFTDDVVDLVREGYDLGIRVGTIIDPRYVALPLYPNRRVVCGTPDYFARHGRPLTPEALRQHECLALNLSGGQHRNWMFQRDGVAFTVRVGGGLDCNDGELLTMWVKSSRPRLALDLGNRAGTREWCARHRPGRVRPAALQHPRSLSPATTSSCRGAPFRRSPARGLQRTGLLAAHGALSLRATHSRGRTAYPRASRIDTCDLRQSVRSRRGNVTSGASL